jgi:SAM-dependent methyltransferase
MRLAACLLLLATAGVGAQEEVPFITTPDRVTLAMLELAQVGPNDHVIDLGSGDGRIVITAARRFGASGLGVEIVPELVRKSRDNARAAGVAERVEFREQDLFATDLRRASVVTLYLLPEINLQLRPRLLALPAGTRIVSHDWDMGDWAPERSVTLDVPDKAIGRAKRSTVHLWRVPARVDGVWCSAGATLPETQRLGQFSAVLHTAAQRETPALVFDGRIAGTRLHAHPPHDTELQADAQGLRVVRIGTPGADVAGRVFKRGDC